MKKTKVFFSFLYFFSPSNLNKIKSEKKQQQQKITHIYDEIITISVELSTHAWRIKLIGAVTALLIYKLSTYNLSFSRFAESKCSSMWEFAESQNKIKIIIIFVFNKIAAYNFHIVFIQLQIEMFCCAQSTHILILFDNVNFINMFSVEKEAWLYIFSSIGI